MEITNKYIDKTIKLAEEFEKYLDERNVAYDVKYKFARLHGAIDSLEYLKK